jgi:uncharacterized membrane protein
MTTIATASSSDLKTRANTKKLRFWEVDALRGIAIILVVFYHFVWDVSYFELYPVDVLSPPWQIFARGIGSTFIFILGLSLTLSYNREVQRLGYPAPFSKFLRRGSKIFGLGLIITVVTYVAVGQGFVIFGILHLLGLGIVLAYPLLRVNKWFSLGVGLLLIGLGTYLNTLSVSHPWLIWLGLKQQGRLMVDFYPLFPWFGITLLGVFVGRVLYPQGVPRLSVPDLSSALPVRGLRFLGQYTLLIYLVHQPILIGILVALGFAALWG